MKKQAIILAIFTLISLSLLAQEKAKDSKFELQLDASQFVLQYLSFGDAEIPVNDYLFQASYHFNPLALKIGGSMNNSKSTTDPNTENTYQTVESYSNTNSLRLGLEYTLPISGKWDVFASFDCLYEYHKSKTKNLTKINPSMFETYTRKTNGYEYGFGPSLGIKFKINDRIALSTETRLYKKSYFSTTRNNYSLGTEENKKSKYENTNLYLTPPIYVYFSFFI
jgi:hypothetical protein